MILQSYPRSPIEYPAPHFLESYRVGVKRVRARITAGSTNNDELFADRRRFGLVPFPDHDDEYRIRVARDDVRTGIIRAVHDAVPFRMGGVLGVDLDRLRHRSRW